MQKPAEKFEKKHVDVTVKFHLPNQKNFEFRKLGFSLIEEY